MSEKATEVVSIESPPKEGQNVQHDGKVLITVKEGKAYILVPANASTTLDPKTHKDRSVEHQSVFYNPIQQFNRDLSVLAIKAFGDDLLAVRRQKVEIKLQSKKRANEKRGVKRKADEVLAPSPRQPVACGASKMDTQCEMREDVPTQVMPDEQEEEQTQVLAKVSNGTGRVEEPSAPPKGDVQSNCDQPAFKMKFRILDALSATGLRALRYAQEVPLATSITANDLSPQATASIELNVRHNRLQDKIKAITGNALTHMYNLIGQPIEGPAKQEGRYDVIDLDPYGTAAPFLDAAVQALNDGGLLCVTCTDAGVWASCGYPEKTYSLYGGTPIKGLHSHEGGLRLILHAVASSAARYGLSIEPLLSLSIDFYARVFVRVHRSPAEVKLLAGKTMLVYSCDGGCGAWQTQFLARNTPIKSKNGESTFIKHGLAQGPPCSPHCEFCGFKLHMSGPMYGGPLHNPAFIETILSSLPELDKFTYATIDRIEGMLSTALEETLIDDDATVPAREVTTAAESNDNASTNLSIPPTRPIPRADPSQIDAYPFFFIPSALAKVLHCRAPAEAEIRGALRHAGYKATRSHAKPGSIRTNAPWSFLWEVMKEWMRQKAPAKEGAIKRNSAGWGIMGMDKNSTGATAAVGADEAEVTGVEVVEVTGEVIKAHDDAEMDIDTDSVTKNEGVNGALEGGVGMTETGDGAAEEEAFQIIKEATGSQRTSQRKTRIIFDARLGREAGKKRLIRYQANPRANWGPMNRATGAKGAKLGGGGGGTAKQQE